MSDEVGFLHGDKHQIFLHGYQCQNVLQVYTTFLMGLARHSYITQNCFEHLCDTSRNNLAMKLILCTQENIKVIHKLNDHFWYGQHAQITQNNKFAIF